MHINGNDNTVTFNHFGEDDEFLAWATLIVTIIGTIGQYL